MITMMPNLAPDATARDQCETKKKNHLNAFVFLLSFDPLPKYITVYLLLSGETINLLHVCTVYQTLFWCTNLDQYQVTYSINLIKLAPVPS